MIGSDGFITLEALRWISDVGASVRDVGPQRQGARCHWTCLFIRCQAPQSAGARSRQWSGTQDFQRTHQPKAGWTSYARSRHAARFCNRTTIERFRAELPSTESYRVGAVDRGSGSKTYWQAWSDLPIRWPRKDERRVPEHWKRFGSRISPLTHSPRLAANPPNALLNFLYAILEAEARLSAVAMGLDPGIGFLHVDTPSRDSLACDLMEVCRPRCDAFVLDWLQRESLRKSDFWEDRNGNCRLVSALANPFERDYGYVAQARGPGRRVRRPRALVLDFQAYVQAWPATLGQQAYPGPSACS